MSGAEPIPKDIKAYVVYPWWKRMLRLRARDLPRVVRKLRGLAVHDDFTDIYRAVRPFTMLNHSRARALYDGVRQVVAAGVPGNLVECGSARGGSAALLALTLKGLAEPPQSRTVIAFDSFAGLPAPSLENPDYELARHWTGHCRGDLDAVRAMLAELGVADLTECVKGLFQETLPQRKPGPIAMLHLDGDWYESTRVCLEHLWDCVSAGGIVQIDDYGAWAGARKAVDEFLAAKGVPLTRLGYVDPSGRQLSK